MITARRIAVKLHPTAETILKKGHPWIFSDSISKLPADARTGDVAVIFSQRDNKLIGVGLYDAQSPIRIKMLSANRPLQVDQDFFSERLKTALQIRRAFVPEITNAFRWVYGESDFLPHMVIDVYNDVVVLKLYSSIWLPYLDWVREAITRLYPHRALVLRLSRNVSKDLGGQVEEGVISGSLEDPEVIFQEYGVNFSAHVIRGHKTGYFLDHRYNRHQVGLMSEGKAVLDVFSYAGGFSTHALAGGAREVVSIDISVQALEMAGKNAGLNHCTGRHTTLAGDAFELLKSQVSAGKTYDIVVIDPPSFAKRQSEVMTALSRYEKLAMYGIQLCKKGGTLVLASCSSRISEADFLAVHQEAFRKMKTPMKLIRHTGHDWDHPVSIPESAYLKTAYYSL